MNVDVLLGRLIIYFDIIVEKFLLEMEEYDLMLVKVICLGLIYIY